MKVIVKGLIGKYNERNLSQCNCGKHYYPSKKMFAEFLKQYKDVKAEVHISSTQNFATGEVGIHLDLKYKVKPILKEK